MPEAKKPTTRSKQVELTDEPGTELVPATDSSFAVVRATAGGDSTLAQVLAENTGVHGLNEFDLDRVVMPAGGVTTWMVPTLAGDEPMQSIEGIIVAWREPRGYWKLPLDVTGGGTPPDCSSNEGVHGVGDPGGDCKSCPLAQWGSDPRDDSNAQACKQRRLLFVVREGDYLPIVVSLAPGSLKAINKYFLRLSSQNISYRAVVTKLALTRAQSAGGITYAQVDPSMVRQLTPAESAAVVEYGAGLRGAFEAVTISQEETSTV